MKPSCPDVSLAPVRGQGLPVDFALPQPHLIAFEDIQRWLSTINPTPSGVPHQQFQTHLAIAARLAIPEVSLVLFVGEIHSSSARSDPHQGAITARMTCLRYQDRLIWCSKELLNQPAHIRAALEEKMIKDGLGQSFSSKKTTQTTRYALGEYREVVDPVMMLHPPSPLKRVLSEKIAGMRLAHLQAVLLERGSLCRVVDGAPLPRL